jgi:hypothetical protein
MVYKDDFSMNTCHKCDYCDNNNGTFMTCNICAKTWCASNQHCYDSHFLNCKGIENDGHKHTSNISSQCDGILLSNKEQQGYHYEKN